MVEEQIKLCAVCAWREFCQKKFTIQQEAGSFRCPDFVRDVSIKSEEEEEKKNEEKD
ncbi:MAG: hypothetical protein LWW95_00165 [Candidatus Desulfofervidus auxilii]|nr:hypothetical protein [Candidatus Desulfofervidus auxilii]